MGQINMCHGQPCVWRKNHVIDFVMKLQMLHTLWESDSKVHQLYTPQASTSSFLLTCIDDTLVRTERGPRWSIEARTTNADPNNLALCFMVISQTYFCRSWRFAGDGCSAARGASVHFEFVCDRTEERHQKKRGVGCWRPRPPGATTGGTCRAQNLRLDGTHPRPRRVASFKQCFGCEKRVPHAVEDGSRRTAADKHELFKPRAPTQVERETSHSRSAGLDFTRSDEQRDLAVRAALQLRWRFGSAERCCLLSRKRTCRASSCARK